MGRKKNNLPKLRWIAGIGAILLITGTVIYLKTSSPPTPVAQETEGAQNSTPLPRKPEQERQQELEKLARSFTVKIISAQGGGSGILIHQKGQIYTVLTAKHVLKPGETTRLETPDGQVYEPIQECTDSLCDPQEVDLAILQFQSEKKYSLASLENPTQVERGGWVFTAGFPFGDKSSADREFDFTLGGYQLGYTNNVRKGMTGGPVMNREGKVIDINDIRSHPLWGNPYIYENGKGAI